MTSLNDNFGVEVSSSADHHDKMLQSGMNRTGNGTFDNAPVVCDIKDEPVNVQKKIGPDDDNILMNDVKKKRRKREKVNVKRTKRKPEPPHSPTNTDESLPSLNKIRFDDNIVAITDPQAPTKPSKNSDKEGKGDRRTPPQTITTAETFTTDDEAESERQLNVQVKKMKSKTNKIEKKEREAKITKIDYDDQTQEKNKKESNPSSRREELAEPRICVGGQMYSMEDLESTLKKLTELKQKQSESGNRRPVNPNGFDSSRASKATSPQKKKITLQPRSSTQPLIQIQSRASSRVPSLPPSRPPSKTSSQRIQLTNFTKESMPNKPTMSVLNFNRIDSCRTSKAASPIGDKGVAKQRILVGGRFMTVDEAEDLFQRLVKANKGKRAAQRSAEKPSDEAKRNAQRSLSVEKGEDDQSFLTPRTNLSAEIVRKNDAAIRKNDLRRRRLSAETTEENDSSFSHLNLVLRTEEEVTAILFAVIIGVIFFIALCISLKRSVQ